MIIFQIKGGRGEWGNFQKIKGLSSSTGKYKSELKKSRD